MQGMEWLNPTAACVLGLLQLGPVPGAKRNPDPEAMTGWQIYETAANSLSRFWNVTRSQVYLELPRLAEAGLVEDSRRGGPPHSSRPYRITEAGRKAFGDWLTEWAALEPRDDQLRSPLLLTVFFGDYLSRETLRRVLQEYRPRYQRQLEQSRKMLEALGTEESNRHIPPTAVLQRGIAYREMMVRWIDGVLEELGGLD
jgi:DNA-binding PadR family transcriptional regulator